MNNKQVLNEDILALLFGLLDIGIALPIPRKSKKLYKAAAKDYKNLHKNFRSIFPDLNTSQQRQLHKKVMNDLDELGKEFKELLKQVNKDYDKKKVKESIRMISNTKSILSEGKLNEISVKAGLEDVIKGRTTSIEGFKISKDMAEAIMDWIKSSSYGRKYGKQILKGRIHALIKPANSWGIERFFKGRRKSSRDLAFEWAKITGKLKEAAINEGVPFPQTTPNEFVFFDFKKWAYKNRGRLKKELLKHKDSPGKLWNKLSDIWMEWAKKTNNKEFSRITDRQKFGRALAIMLKKENVLIAKNSSPSHKITVKEQELTKDQIILGKAKNNRGNTLPADDVIKVLKRYADGPSDEEIAKQQAQKEFEDEWIRQNTLPESLDLMIEQEYENITDMMKDAETAKIISQYQKFKDQEPKWYETAGSWLGNALTRMNPIGNIALTVSDIHKYHKDAVDDAFEKGKTAGEEEGKKIQVQQGEEDWEDAWKRQNKLQNESLDRMIAEEAIKIYKERKLDE